MNEIIEENQADALINITVESYTQWWILFIREVIVVEAEAIRFRK